MEKESLIKSIHCGLNNGYEKYLKMSGGESIFCGPEYFMATSIAYALNDNLEEFGCYVTLEYPLKNMIEKSDHKELNKSLLLKAKKKAHKKVDILLWKKAEEAPFAIIEVKSHIAYGSYAEEPISENGKRCGNDLRHDICRMSELLAADSYNNLQFGIVAFYAYYDFLDNKKDIESHIKTKIKKLELSVKDDEWNLYRRNSNIEYLHPNKYKEEKEYGNSYLWTAGSILIKKQTSD